MEEDDLEGFAMRRLSEKQRGEQEAASLTVINIIIQYPRNEKLASLHFTSLHLASIVDRRLSED